MFGANGPCTALRILVVDGHKDSADSQAILLQLQGFVVETAYSPEAAFASVQNHPPDVLILEIALPGEDGWTLARRLRPLFPHRPLLLAITCCGRLEDIRQSRAAGFHFHLVKPVDPAVVSALVRFHASIRRENRNGQQG